MKYIVAGLSTLLVLSSSSALATTQSGKDQRPSAASPQLNHSSESESRIIRDSDARTTTERRYAAGRSGKHESKTRQAPWWERVQKD